MARHSVSLGPMLPEQFYRPIGHLVAVWARLEEEIDNLLEDLHRCPAVAALGDIPATFARRAKRLKDAAALCFPTTPTLLDKINSIEQRAFRLGQDRNLIVHGRIWFCDRLIAFNTKRELALSLDAVEKLTHEIAVLAAELATMNSGDAIVQLRPGRDPLTPLEREALRNLRSTSQTGDHPRRPTPPSVLRQRQASRKKG
jgi:hypothetical protein